MVPPPRLVTAARILIGLSQADLAEEAKIGIATLRRYERGETNPRADKANAILRVLRAHGIQFLDESDTVAMGVVLLKSAGGSGS
ncbi:MAG TPA: helix-turn-helix transcriptional regulator [Steroidobacteraceae bacterium]|nr:helix-turn-helix transcriptional regulator [Steroidobacteraceae bacterium]